MLPQVEDKERAGVGVGGTQQHLTATAAAAAQDLLRTLKVMERKPRLHMHAGRLGGRQGWRKPRGGCQETAIWEQGQRG